MIPSTSPLPRPFTVVVGIDFSPSSDRALATARTLCALSSGYRLHAVHALSPAALTSEEAVPPSVSRELEVARIATARMRLARRVRFTGMPEGGEVNLHVHAGIAHQVITDVARGYGADLILVGTRGLRTTRRVLAFSLSDHVARHAPCTVIAVRTREIHVAAASASRAGSARW